jgi:hypothetical protein
MQLCSLVTEFLEPVFWHIKSAREIQELLFRDDKPFEWWATNTVLRAAEIVALTPVARTEWANVRSRMSSFEKKLPRDMYGSTDSGKLIDDLSRALLPVH